MPAGTPRKRNPFVDYVRENYSHAAMSLEHRAQAAGHPVRFSDVIKKLAASYHAEGLALVRAPKNVCDEAYEAKCAKKGKVCNVNKSRKSCRKPRA